MPLSTRRAVLALFATPLVLREASAGMSAAPEGVQFFVREAFRMRAEAVASGDHHYGAVIVMDDAIVGYGPSRVVIDRNLDAHAERVALWDAQSRLDRADLAGAVIYSTSPPCSICQRALAKAGIAQMYHGQLAAEGGPPRGR